MACSKRGSLHQTICLIESLINRNYDQTRWNEQKQNNIGNDLRKRGAVRKKDPFKSIYSYFTCFNSTVFRVLYIDSSTTPNTVKSQMLVDTYIIFIKIALKISEP